MPSHISSQSPTAAKPLSTAPAEPTLMFKEAGESHSVVARQLMANAPVIARIAERLRQVPPRAVVTCGRGSSDHAATFAKYLVETRLGVVTASAALSVSSVYAIPQQLDGTLYLAISQSGKSPDLIACVQAAKTAGAFTVALVNDAQSPLAQLVDEVVLLHAGPELSVAATKSYIASLSAAAHLVAAWAEDGALLTALDHLADHLADAWALDWSPALTSLKSASNLFILGRGLGFGVAQEAALKLKETCGLHAEAFSAAELKHGPMALIGAGFPSLVFAQNDETYESVIETAQSLAQRGADIWLAGGSTRGAKPLPALTAHPALQPVLIVQSFYRLANALSLARGFNPDIPPYLNKITETV